MELYSISLSFLQGDDKGELVSGLDILAPLLLIGRRRGWGMRRFQYGNGMARPALFCKAP